MLDNYDKTTIRVNGEPTNLVARLATTPFRRMRGLLGQPDVPKKEVLLISPCSSIHCWFMRIPITVVYLSAVEPSHADRATRTVLAVAEVRPWHLGFGPRGTRAVLECRAGTDVFSVGDRVEFVPVAASLA